MTTHENVAAQTPLLAVRNLKTYFFLDEGLVQAVDGVNFEVHPGRILGVVGESGCGKSMTARSIMQLIDEPGRIVDGQILYRRALPNGQVEEIDLARLDPDGRAIRAIRGKEIAWIFQEPMTALSPVHTVGNQIVETIMLHTQMSKREAFARGVEMLRSVGIPLPEQRMDDYSHQLSGGLRQRAIIAIALSCNPRLLIADEPTTAIDVTTQAQILRLLRRMQAENDMAMLFITHDLGVIAELADDVIVMYLGRVVERAGVDDIFHQPKHPYTKALLRSIPRLDGPMRTILPTIAGSIPHPQNRPVGCPFHPRCEAAMPGICDVHTPQLLELEEDNRPQVHTTGSVATGPAPSHSVSCFLYHPPDHAAGDGADAVIVTHT